MRFIQDIPHARFRIGLYAWNGKHIIKIDAGPYEQTYKIADLDLTTPDDVPALLDAAFLDSVARRFSEMDADWTATLSRHEVG